MLMVVLIFKEDFSGQKWKSFSQSSVGLETASLVLARKSKNVILFQNGCIKF